MASRLDDLLAKISEIEKSVEELRLLLPIPAVTTPVDGSPNHEAVNLYPSLQVDESTRSVYLLVSSYGPKYANAIYEVKFKHGVGVTHEHPLLVGLVAKFHEGLCFQAAQNFNRSKLYCLVQEGGHITDTKTKSICSSISPSLAPKSIATVVCAYAPFDGRVVVVGKTIYALHGKKFIAFSFKMDKDDDCDVTYSLRKLFIL